MDNKTRNVRTNVTFRCVRLNVYCCNGKAISITYSGCGSVAFVIQHAKRMRHTVTWPARLYYIFPHYLINGAIFRKKMTLKINVVIWFSLQLLSEMSFIIRSERDMIKKKFEYSRQIFEKWSNENFHENPFIWNRQVGRCGLHQQKMLPCTYNYKWRSSTSLNLLATDFFFQILAHPVFKMWVIQNQTR